MRYMFLIYATEGAETAAHLQQATVTHHAIMDEAEERGVFGGAAPLKPACTATTVRGKREHLFVTDGPFADTKEQLAGYYILECADLDDAIAWAKKIPRTSESDHECVEIRPIQEMRSRE